MRLSVGLCTVHDIIARARLYDIKGGSMHSMRHRSRLLWIRCADKILHTIR